MTMHRGNKLGYMGLLGLVLGLAMMLSLSGCMYSASTSEITYKAMGAAGIAYDQGMRVLADLDDQGKLSVEAKELALSKGKLFKQSYDMMVDALASYKIGGISESTLDDKLASYMAVYEDFMSLMHAIIDESAKARTL